ncbi:hypothetical protein PBCVNEJV1_138R [Paramecium bursaria Chlorella virus NE-JV-1]|nr:hypothetical protein PBCVNEJV1_138R [Paramecium bursaria Chlorella virus NE-JV-1]
MSVVHFVKIMKNKKEDDGSAETIKAIVYVSGAIVLILLLVYRPFDTSKIAKIFKSKPVSVDTTATLIATTAFLGSTGVGV